VFCLDCYWFDCVGLYPFQIVQPPLPAKFTFCGSVGTYSVDDRAIIILIIIIIGLADLLDFVGIGLLDCFGIFRIIVPSCPVTPCRVSLFIWSVRMFENPAKTCKIPAPLCRTALPDFGC
jgi:hypothetical protein